MADIPDELVIRRVENGVDGDGQFNNAQACAQMPARDGDSVDHFRTDFIGQLLELVARKARSYRTEF